MLRFHGEARAKRRRRAFAAKGLLFGGGVVIVGVFVHTLGGGEPEPYVREYHEIEPTPEFLAAEILYRDRQAPNLAINEMTLLLSFPADAVETAAAGVEKGVTLGGWLNDGRASDEELAEFVRQHQEGVYTVSFRSLDGEWEGSSSEARIGPNMENLIFIELHHAENNSSK